jgi:Cu/Ag efflux pump CusA
MRSMKCSAHENAIVPHGAIVHVRGQGGDDESTYEQLLAGLAFSILLVYLVIVVNFQSWLDPFIIITALPGALTGIIWALFLTDTTSRCPRSPARSCAWALRPRTRSWSSLSPARAGGNMAIQSGRPWKRRL